MHCVPTPREAMCVGASGVLRVMAGHAQVILPMLTTYHLVENFNATHCDKLLRLRVLRWGKHDIIEMKLYGLAHFVVS